MSAVEYIFRDFDRGAEMLLNLYNFFLSLSLSLESEPYFSWNTNHDSAASIKLAKEYRQVLSLAGSSRRLK